MGPVAEHNLVQNIAYVFLKIIGMQVGGNITVHWVKSQLSQVQAMIFSNYDDGRWTTKGAALLLCSHLEQQLIPRLFVAIPPGNHTGQTVCQQTISPVVLLNDFQRVGFIIGVYRSVKASVADECGALVDQFIIEVIQKNDRFKAHRLLSRFEYYIGRDGVSGGSGFVSRDCWILVAEADPE